VTAARELDGAAAPPMSNGELVFDAPWQGRVFGIARDLADRGVYQWDDFRARLIDEIASFDRGVAASGAPAPPYHYYDHFLRALEVLLVERGLIEPGELGARIDAFAQRPHDYDHDHDHDHDHDRDHDHD
jgi:nitrile hydratase accessory protein